APIVTGVQTCALPIWSSQETADSGGRGLTGRGAAAACGERIPTKLASLGFGERATPGEKAQVVQKLRPKYALSLLLEIAQLPREIGRASWRLTSNTSY